MQSRVSHTDCCIEALGNKKMDAGQQIFKCNTATNVGLHVLAQAVFNPDSGQRFRSAELLQTGQLWAGSAPRFSVIVCSVSSSRKVYGRTPKRTRTWRGPLGTVRGATCTRTHMTSPSRPAGRRSACQERLCDTADEVSAACGANTRRA